MLLMLLKASSWQPAHATRPTGTIPVSFEGSALLITYYSGIAQALQERGVIVPGVTPISGLSGGAFTAVLSGLGMTGMEQRELWKDILQSCANRFGSCIGRLTQAQQDLLDDVLPENVTEYVNGMVRVGLSQLNSDSLFLNNSASWVVDSWTSKADVKSSLLGTSYIPCYTGSNVYRLFRNQPVVDGGFANGFFDLCHSPNDECIKIASWYIGDKANSTCLPTCSAAPNDCITEERTPGEQVTELYENSEYVDQWPLADVQERCPESVFAGEAPYPLPAFVPHNSTAVDIHPGKYNSLPVFNGSQLAACQWQDWAMALPEGMEIEAADVIYQQGYMDALAWCNEQGYT